METKRTDGAATANRLAREPSPYLRDHAHNPVDWHPWGDAAFDKARAEDKPIFLSIGYASCHWCHVMERESFNDPVVARVMNDLFVPVKVDREERPDIDAACMAFCRAAGASCGWPLTVLMTPDARPFYVTTYIPREARHGHAGIIDLLGWVGARWRAGRGALTEAADQLAAAARAEEEGRHGNAPDDGVFTDAFEELRCAYDEEHGGFGGAPKFPMPHVLMFLLRYWRRTADERALAMVETTLERMRRGGIYDHLGFGFHRYATDAEWRVPHFEKMLYDQALIAMAYLEAFQATGKPLYETTAREVFTYVLRDLAMDGGAFAGSEDADSDGREGGFYVWTEDEVRRVLPRGDADLAARAFSLAGPGELIIERARATGDLAADRSMDPYDLASRLEGIRLALLRARTARTRPRRDDKVLTDWNGLMIAALARGAQTFDEPFYADAARRAASFVLDRLRDGDGRLLHRWFDGDAGVEGTAADYAYLVWGLLDLYEATFETRWLTEAIALHRRFAGEFWDVGAGGFFLSVRSDLPLKVKELHDGTTPAPASVGLINGLRIARMTGDLQGEDLPGRAAAAAGRDLAERPSSFATLLWALDFHRRDSWQVVIAGRDGAADTRDLLRALRGAFIPEKVVLLRPADDAHPPITAIAPYTTDQVPPTSRATAYVCRAFACALPTTDPAEMLAQLGTGPNVPVPAARS